MSSTPPGSGRDLQDPAAVADLFAAAADANLNDPRRHGSVVELGNRGRLVMTGDLHDHSENLLRILRLARLEEDGDHMVVLHEVIHGDQLVNRMDLSVRTLARIAALKVERPTQVLMLQSNHELAQLTGEGILKKGASVVEAFEDGIDFIYGSGADRVRDAVRRFIGSLPLAIRCENGVFCAHSIPSPRKLDVFDKTVIDRVPTDDDYQSSGSAYMMVWGRFHNQVLEDELAEAWGVTVFVLGHQPAEMGHEVEAGRILILASDHGHGCALPIDLSRTWTRDALVEQIVPLAAVRIA